MRVLSPLLLGFGLVVGFAASGCVFTDRSCGDRVCTAILISIAVTVVDASGEPVPGMATKTVYIPTGAILYGSRYQNDHGRYVLIDDTLDTSQLLPGERHELRFYAHSERGTASGDFVIRAGECVCHVELLSGPDRLMLQPF